MTKQEQKDFDKMFKAIVKHGRLVYNGKLPRAHRLGDAYASTVVIPTFKVLKEINKFVQKHKGESCKPTKSKRSSKKS